MTTRSPDGQMGPKASCMKRVVSSLEISPGSWVPGGGQGKLTSWRFVPGITGNVPVGMMLPRVLKVTIARGQLSVFSFFLHMDVEGKGVHTALAWEAIGTHLSKHEAVDFIKLAPSLPKKRGDFQGYTTYLPSPLNRTWFRSPLIWSAVGTTKLSEQLRPAAISGMVKLEARAKSPGVTI